MKKLISLASLFLLLALLVPPHQAEADRGWGGSRGFGDSRGSGRPEGYSGRGGSGGYKGPQEYPGQRGYRGQDRHTGPGWYGGLGGFLPGLIIGGALGWSLAPRYYYPYYPPSYYNLPPPEENQPPQSLDQGAENRMFIYPRQGQSEGQQAMDFDVCHGWAVNQTGFDPKRPPEGPPDAQRSQQSTDYLRAISACLDARGYTLR
jgi:hypothetical protein